MIKNVDLFKIIRYYEEYDDGKKEYTNHWNNNSEEMVFERLGRAIGNANSEQVQTKLAPATPSRFAIWSADIIWLIQCAIKEMNIGNNSRAEELLLLAKRSLCAFTDCCRLYDTEDGYMQFENATDIISLNYDDEKK